MAQSPKSFEVYGFTIEVHPGGRRVWPPSFKRFVREGLDSGKLTLADVKRIEGSGFVWPRMSDGVITINRSQFEALFEGLDWQRVFPRHVRKPVAV